MAAASIVRAALLIAVLASPAAASVLMQNRSGAAGVARDSSQHLNEFRGAIKSLDLNDTEDAIVSLRRALEMQPEDSRRVFIYAGRFERYAPHFFLAKAMAAHAKKGNRNICADAREHLKLAESGVDRGEIADVEELIARNCGA